MKSVNLAQLIAVCKKTWFSDKFRGKLVAFGKDISAHTSRSLFEEAFAQLKLGLCEVLFEEDGACGVQEMFQAQSGPSTKIVRDTKLFTHDIET